MEDTPTEARQFTEPPAIDQQTRVAQSTETAASRQDLPTGRNPLHWWRYTFIGHYADFTGRARRWEFDLAWLFFVLVVAGAAAIRQVGPDAVFLLLALGMVGLIPPLFAVTCRRMHDIDMAGARFFLVFIPLIGTLFFFYLVLALAFTYGSSEPNAWGPAVKPKSKRFT